jgi:hypothetical protein
MAFTAGGLSLLERAGIQSFFRIPLQPAAYSAGIPNVAVKKATIVTDHYFDRLFFTLDASACPHAGSLYYIFFWVGGKYR